MELEVIRRVRDVVLATFERHEECAMDDEVDRTTLAQIVTSEIFAHFDVEDAGQCSQAA